MSKPELYRKRYIPNEIVHLKDDEIIEYSMDRIITRWRCLKPRCDFASGVSLYLPKQGIKVSRILDCEGHLCHYYCDIIHTDYSQIENKYVFTDLLADVVVFPDGSYKVLDLDELADAFKQGLITNDEISYCLESLHGLLQDIYNGKFIEYTDIVDKI